MKKEAGQVLSKEQSELVSRLDKALQVLKGKQVLIDISGGIMTNQLYENFHYKFFGNCQKENLLDFQDENNAEAPTVCINLNNIYDVAINDSASENYVEGIKIQLKDKSTIRLQLKR